MRKVIVKLLNMTTAYYTNEFQEIDVTYGCAHHMEVTVEGSSAKSGGI